MGRKRLREAIAALVRTAGSLPAFVRNRRRQAEPTVPRLSALLRQKAIADPLSAMWTELNWLVTDDPWMDHTLTDVDRVMAILNQPEEPTNFIAPALMSALDAIDIDAIINQLRIRRAIGLEKGSAPVDALGMYLRTLGTRSPAGAQNPLVAVLTRAR